MKLAIGTAQFGLNYGISNYSGQVEKKEVNKILDYCKKVGISNLDTANMYGNSENILGDLGLKGFKVISKISKIDNPNNAYEETHYSVTNSLESLKLKSLDGIMVHSQNDLLQDYSKKIFKKLYELKLSGIVKSIGISLYSLNDLRRIVKEYDIDFIQFPLNPFDKRVLENEITELLNEKNITIHARSIFLQGLLLKPLNEIPEYFSPWKKFFSDWHEWLRARSLSPLEGCLYSLKPLKVERIIIGVGSLNQLKQIVSIYNSNNIVESPIFGNMDPKLINPSLWKKN